MAVGVGQGDAIAIQGPISYPWAVADMAALWIGAIVVPIFDSAAPEQVEFIVEDARVIWAFVDSPSQRQQVENAIDNDQADTYVWNLSLGGQGLGGLIDLGRDVTDQQLEERRVQPSLDDIATLVYTSGTEGRPKGVIITHRNLVGQVLNIGVDYREVVNAQGRTLIFLPLAHVLARGLQLICLSEGMTISYESNPGEAIAALSEVEPTFLVVVPRVLQKILERIAATAQDQHLGWLWKNAEKAAVTYGTYTQRRQYEPELEIPFSLRWKRALYDRIFFSRVRSLLGGHIEHILSGAAPLEEKTALLFRGMGVEVIEGYGLTETTAPVTGNRPGDNCAGTVGKPEPGHTIRIASSGEILAKGVGVSPGYWNPEDNHDAFVDGFLRTGDIGTLDADGRLTITGRVKEMIVTSGGKTISPQLWEREVEADPLVAHAVVVGDSQPYPAALVFLDSDELGRIGLGDESKDGQVDTVNTPRIVSRITETLRRANRRVSKPERVKRFNVLLADLTPGGNLVTSTMKFRRGQLTQDLKKIVDDLYRSGRVL